MSQTTEKRSRFARFGQMGRRVSSGVRWRLCGVLAQQLSAAPAGCRTARPDPGVDRATAARKASRAEKLTARKQEREAAEFQRALDAGEMPPLQPFVFITDYSPSDLATMLQSGGVQLLDVQTLTALRNDESVIRWGLAGMARYQKLSDELIVPNLNQDISFFYDPTTKKLRKQFEIYPEALQANVKFANDLERTHTELLKQIQAERQRNR